jgi:hypothetical protein
LTGGIHGESATEEKDSAPSEHWPRKKTRQTLEQKIKALSDVQRVILGEIAKADGISAYTLTTRLRDASAVHHRINTLENEALITQDRGNLYAAATVKKLHGDDTLPKLRG